MPRSGPSICGPSTSLRSGLPPESNSASERCSASPRQASRSTSHDRPCRDAASTDPTSALASDPVDDRELTGAPPVPHLWENLLYRIKWKPGNEPDYF
jgi:hypothetical protein